MSAEPAPRLHGALKEALRQFIAERAAGPDGGRPIDSVEIVRDIATLLGEVTTTSPDFAEQVRLSAEALTAISAAQNAANRRFGVTPSSRCH